MSDPKPPLTPSRALVLNLMLSLLMSVAVFVVVSWLVIVPELARQELEIRALRTEVENIKAEMDEEEEAAPAVAAAAAPAAAAPAAGAAAAPAAAPAANAPGAPAAAPTPAPAATPAPAPAAPTPAPAK